MGSLSMKRYTPAIVMIVGLTLAPVFGCQQLEPQPDQFSICFRGTIGKQEWRFQIMLDGPNSDLVGTLRKWNDKGELKAELEICSLKVKNTPDKGRRIKINKYDYNWFTAWCCGVTRLTTYDIKMAPGTLSGL